MAVSFWEVLERCHKGERMDENVFDMSIFKKVEELKKEIGLTYSPDSPIFPDDNLIDQVFEAGIKFYASVGTFCTDTKRVIRFTEDEIRQALSGEREELFFGDGEDRIKVYKRKIEDEREPVVCAGLQTLVYSDEEMMFKILLECAKDRRADGIWGGIIFKMENGGEVIAGTPNEIYSYKKNVKTMREAIRAAGRQGLCILNNAPTSIATIAMRDPERGLRRTDPMMSFGISEMKISFDDLNRTSFALAYGCPINGNHTTIIGAFSGSVEGNAIVSVAGSLQSLMVNRAWLIRPEIHDISIKSSVTRKELWIGSVAFQAIARNANFALNGGLGDHPAAGPGTKQYLYETAAGHILSTVCGGHSTGGTRKFVIGKRPNFGTPLESRWMGEVCKGSTGLSREKANEIILYLLQKYEPHLQSPPEGETFESLYVQYTFQPQPEYQKMYNEVKEELAGLGIKFKD